MNFISVIVFIIAFYVYYIKLEVQDTYTAIVVDYYPVTNPNLELAEIIEKNTDAYVELLESIGSPLDIIVYPEATLDDSLFLIKNIDAYTFVPSPDETATPCKAADGYYPNFFKKLSCAARKHSVYLVINLVEKEKCKVEDGHCADYGYNLYNTDVVFDRTGMIVARYRKYHLFGEHPKNQTKEVEIVTFDTDFGVTFGIFTCFDILFEKPALELARRGVKHVIFPTMWFSELPFLTALQAQLMWAEANNVNLFAANANNGKLGNGGTGIYNGRNGSVVLVITTDKDSTMHMAEVHKEVTDSVVPNDTSNNVNEIDLLAENMENFRLLKDDVEEYKSVLMDLTKRENRVTVCSGEEPNRLCCRFDYKINVDRSKMQEDKDQYTYHIVAFTGVRSFHHVDNGGVELCAVIACLNRNVSSCGQRFEKYSNITWPVTFENIKIEATFDNVHTKQQYPNSLLSSIRPIPARSREWHTEISEDGKKIQRTHILKDAQSRLMTFAIYGRDFNRDTQAMRNPILQEGVV